LIDAIKKNDDVKARPKSESGSEVRGERQQDYMKIFIHHKW